MTQPMDDTQDDDIEEADHGKCPYCGRVLILDGTTWYCELGCF